MLEQFFNLVFKTLLDDGNMLARENDKKIFQNLKINSCFHKIHRNKNSIFLCNDVSIFEKHTSLSLSFSENRLTISQ